MKIRKLIAIAAVASLAACSFAQDGPGGPGGPPPGQRGPGGPGGPRVGLQPAEMVIRRNDVQSDLALTDDQKTKLQTLLQSMRGPGGGPGGPGGFGGGPGGPPPDGGPGGPPPDGGPGGPPPDGGPGRPGGGGDDFRARMDAMRKKVTDGINAILTADQKTRLQQIRIQLAGSSAAADAGVQTSLKVTSDQKSKISGLIQSLSEANRSVFDKMRNGEIERDEAMTTIQRNSKILGTEIGKVLTSDQTTALTQLGGKPFKATDPERGPGGFGGPGGPGGPGGGAPGGPGGPGDGR